MLLPYHKCVYFTKQRGEFCWSSPVVKVRFRWTRPSSRGYTCTNLQSQVQYIQPHSLPQGSGTIKRNARPCGYLWHAGNGQTQIRVWIGGGWHTVIISRCWNWPSINPDSQEGRGRPPQLLPETRFLWFNDLEKKWENVSSVSNVFLYWHTHAQWFKFPNTHDETGKCCSLRGTITGAYVFTLRF